INKTNQFNLTTIRRTLDEVRALHRSPRHGIYVLKVGDKFGDYGLTGVIVVERRNEQDWLVDTLLLSCRVLGRGVETALLALLAEAARARGVLTLCARFVPTAKNAPASHYLADHGFAPEGAEWRIAVKDVAAMDTSIQRA
ncbi:MAG: HAD-IIIC family phosphatase, partial [Rhizomicrobium sp.]